MRHRPLLKNARPSFRADRWRSSKHGVLSGFILASVGFAVGLGNIWRFPYVTGENGSAFDLLALCLWDWRALMAEFLLGRRGAKSPPFAIATVSAEAKLTALVLGGEPHGTDGIRHLDVLCRRSGLGAVLLLQSSGWRHAGPIGVDGPSRL